MPNEGDRPIFGPIDPYVVLPAAALLSLAVVLLAKGLVVWGLAAAAVAGVVVAFDSWANRGDRVVPSRRPAGTRDGDFRATAGRLPGRVMR